MEKIKRLGGWQCWVEVYKNYVIKTPKNREEIEHEVRKFLTWKGKLEELEKRTNKMVSDIKDSTKIIKKSKIPMRLLADLEFIEDNKVRQKRVIDLNEKIKNSNSEEVKELLDKIIKFWLKLWEYNIHEKTFKFFSNLGWDGKRVVLIDIFELTSDKEKVLKQIKKSPWNKPERFEKNISEKLHNYFMKQLDENLTEKNLDKYWGKLK